MINKIVIYLIGLFDYFHNKKIFKFLKKKKLQKFHLLFDIGAHKGESIDRFLNNLIVKKIVSFEASPKNFEILKKKRLNLQNKYKETKIIIENIALGDTDKNVILNQMLESSSSTIKKLNEKSSYYKKKFKALNILKNKKLLEEIQIKLKTLEEYIKENNYKEIDFIKIDTEGFEYEILRGLYDEISNVKVIMFEHHYDSMIQKNYSFSDIKKLMDKKIFNLIFKAKMPFRKTFEYIYINKKWNLN